MKSFDAFLRFALLVLLPLTALWWITGCANTGTATIAGSGSDSPFATSGNTGRPGLATGWGETSAWKINFEEFKRKANSMEKTVIYYNDDEGAKAMRIPAQAVYRYDLKARRRLHTESDMPSIWLESPGGTMISSYGAPGLPREKNVIGGHRAPISRLFIGQAGDPYVIVLKNNTDKRLEAVVSVDGLDVIDGKSASPNKRGYIVEPQSTLRIPGFRKSVEQIARFEFAPVASSYANQTGGASAARNVGVIGLATFEEENDELNARKAADAFPNKFAQPPPAS